MNTQLTNALSDAQLDTVSGGCYRRSEKDYGCDSSYDSDDYGCESNYDSTDYGCEGGEKNDSDYGSCHKRYRPSHHRHNSCS